MSRFLPLGGLNHKRCRRLGGLRGRGRRQCVVRPGPVAGALWRYWYGWRIVSKFWIATANATKSCKRGWKMRRGLVWPMRSFLSVDQIQQQKENETEKVRLLLAHTGVRF